ncbi:hypothetical protein M422DRAFT_54914 [Sphaerobolus stellatus SS14]|uniref:Uncharacterized protein n=1 Tax=Sphaerobolus stellatus (strain SS14) TaxID=990650 RepID=A0A0C9UFF2_SPHS4|nr:hypothetical protein M422DRAFT_54914 [Sphaerobolus stellatus SS14]
MVGPEVPRPQYPADRRKPPPLSQDVRKANAKKAMDKEDAMQEEVDVLLDFVNKRVVELSEKYSKKDEYFRMCVYLTSKAEKQKRKGSPYNVFLHVTAEKENSELPIGQKMGLIDLVRSGSKKYEELTGAEKDEMMAVLEAYREGKEQGFRVGARSRGQVVWQTMQKLLNLRKQTGVSSFIFTARNNTAVQYKPHFYATDQASKDFVRLALRKDVMNTGCQYEGYLFNNLEGSASNRQARLTKLRNNCSQLIQNGLLRATGEKQIRIKYTDAGYDSLVQRHGFKLEGWPLHELKSPASISAIADLENLETLLENGDCEWVALTDEELRKHVTDYAVRKKPSKKKVKAVAKGSNSKRTVYKVINNTNDDDEDTDDEDSEEEPSEDQGQGEDEEEEDQNEEDNGRKRKSVTKDNGSARALKKRRVLAAQ